MPSSRPRKSHDIQAATVQSEIQPLAAESILNALGDAVVVCDAQGRVRMLNAQARQLLRCNLPLAPEHMPRFADLLPRATQDSTAAETPDAWLMRALGGETVTWEQAMDWLDTPGRLLSMTATPIRNVGNEVVGATVVVREIAGHTAQERDLAARSQQMEGPDGTDTQTLASAVPFYHPDGQLAGVIALARQMDDVHKALAERSALLAITDTALSYMKLDALLPEIVHRLCSVLPIDNAAILLLDADGQTLHVCASQGIEAAIDQYAAIPYGQDVAGHVAATRAPLIVTDVAMFPVVTPILQEKLASVMGVPLMNDDELLDVLHVGTATTHRFTAGELDILMRAADRVAVAIRHAQLFAAEEAARIQAEHTRAQLQTVLDVLPVGVFIADVAGTIVARNAAGRAIWGEGQPDKTAFAAEGAYRAWWEATQEPVQTHEWALSQAVATGRTILNQRLRIQTFDGQERIVLNSAAPIRDGQGAITGGVAALVDITNLTALEREMVARGRETEAILDAIADAIYVYSPDGRLRRTNIAAQRFNPGTTDAAYLSQSFAGRIQPLQKPCVYLHLWLFRPCSRPVF